MTKTNKFYNVIRLHRDDFEGYVPEEVKDNLTNEQLEFLADKIANGIMETGAYWEAIREASKSIDY